MTKSFCNPDTVANCEGKTLRHLCEKCPESPSNRSKISAYTAALHQVHSLLDVGLQFEPDAFDLATWLDLARMKQALRPSLL